MRPLTALWNLDFTTRRQANIRRAIRNRLRCDPKGKGNKAWTRIERQDREPGTITWPHYFQLYNEGDQHEDTLV